MSTGTVSTVDVCEYCGAPGCHWTRHGEARADVARAAREHAAALAPFGDHLADSEVVW